MLPGLVRYQSTGLSASAKQGGTDHTQRQSSMDGQSEAATLANAVPAESLKALRTHMIGLNKSVQSATTIPIPLRQYQLSVVQL